MRILLAVDGSETAAAATREVRNRPWPPSSVVRVIFAFQPTIPPPVTTGWGGGVASGLVPGTRSTYDQLNEQLSRQSDAMVSRVAESLATTELPVETAVRQGPAGSAIVDEAARWKADLIVMGSRGQSGIKRWVLGSVAHFVVGHAPCSVEVVKPPLDSDEQSS